MSTLQTFVVSAAILAVLALAIYEGRRDLQLSQQLRVLQQQQTPLSERIRQLEQEREEAATRLHLAAAEIEQLRTGPQMPELLKLRGEVGRLRQQLASLPTGGFAKMMSDPQMRDYISQNRLAMIQVNFKDLFKELKLTPDQAQKVSQILADSIQRTADKILALPAGAATPAEIAQAEDNRAELDPQLQPLLGESGVARFKEYRKEFPAHALVDLLNGRLGANQLNDEQSARLFQIVKAEPFDLTRAMAGEPDPAFWGSQQEIDDHLSNVAESNQRMMQQAGNYLAPDQLAELNTVLSNTVQLRIAQAAALMPKP